MLIACEEAPQKPAETARQAATPSKKHLEIFASADVAADTEPCGCKMRPLGGVSRRAKVITDRAEKDPVLAVDGGDHFFRQASIAERDVPQAKATAYFLAQSLKMMNVAAMTVGERDLALGLAELRALEKSSGVPILAANVRHARTATNAFQSFTVVERGGLKIGIAGVSAPPNSDVFLKNGLRIDPAGEALIAAAKDARSKGAEVVIALLHLPAQEARAILGAIDRPLIDLAIASHEGGVQAMPEIFGSGATGLLQAGERGKWLLRIGLDVIPGKFGVERADALETAAKDVAAVEARIAEVKKLAQSPDRDALLGRLERRRAQVLAEQGKLEKGAHHAATTELVHLDVSLPDHPALAKLYAEHLAHLEDVNKTRAQQAAERGEVYAGTVKCKSCHQEEHKQWSGTGHARAWATMVRTKQTGNLDCIGCHTTGFDRPGGPASTKGLEKFVNVGCESCHGPGALHVKTPTVALAYGREVPEKVCTECHKQQADQRSFDYQERLQLIRGPGHGY